jgi:hypothetical protein
VPPLAIHNSLRDRGNIVPAFADDICSGNMKHDENIPSVCKASLRIVRRLCKACIRCPRIVFYSSLSIPRILTLSSRRRNRTCNLCGGKGCRIIDVGTHPSKKAVEKLMDHVDGIKIVGSTSAPTTAECEICIQSKLHQIVSRRPPREPATHPFERISIHLVQLSETKEHGYGGDRYLFHSFDEYSKWHNARGIKDKMKATLTRVVKELIAWIFTQFNVKVRFVKCDSERGYALLWEIFKTLGITAERRATEAQAGGIERAGRTIVTVARADRLAAKLPKKLAIQIAETAVYQLNRTPTEAIGWKTPYEVIWGKKPSVAHMRPIGSHAFVYNTKIARGDKLESRAIIGHLVGYNSTNIYLVWIPALDKVIRSRDVYFGKLDDNYDDSRSWGDLTQLEELVEIVEIEDPPEDVYQHHKVDELLDSALWHQLATSQQSPWVARPTSEAVRASNRKGNEPVSRSIGHPISHQSSPSGYINPSTLSPNNPSLINYPPPLLRDSIAMDIYGCEGEGDEEGEAVSQRREGGEEKGSPGGPWLPHGNDDRDDDEQLPRRRGRKKLPPRDQPKGWETLPADATAPDRTRNNASRADEIGGNVTVTGKRAWKPVKYTAAVVGGVYMTTFMTQLYPTALSAALMAEAPRFKRHRNELPEAPNHYKHLQKDPYASEFMKACREEIDAIKSKGVFGRSVAYPIDGVEILPLRWVFTYKFDEDGYLYKFKARLVVRGDLQKSWDDTYAATLAARIFRFLMAIAAAFEMRAYQYDVRNAFLNARLNRLLYVRAPEGFERELGNIIELLYALYGLRDAPALWYMHLTAVLEKAGLRKVPSVPCLYTSDSLIVFFFVDDIVILVHPTKLQKQQELERELTSAYDMRCLGELKWFLGIRVIRDLKAKKIRLLQDSFIEKVAEKFKINSSPSKKTRAVPMYETYLAPSTEEPDLARTTLYNQLVGSLAFLVSMTRPDCARTHSVHARHLKTQGKSTSALLSKRGSTS